MENMVNPRNDFWKKKKVLVTGHTGFKGSWLCLWLHRMGAEICGVSLPPENPSVYISCKVEELVDSHHFDINGLERLESLWRKFEPEVVFHLAAQSLVKVSYSDPINTLTTNVLGTTHVLECARRVRTARVIINVTSDKCYENSEKKIPFKETDPVGGNDIYSCSKACSELITTSFRKSFFAENTEILLASARAGNVIGGGDWCLHRLIPDTIRAARSGEKIELRYPNAVRPWQFVLEPLSGYLLLAEKIWNHGEEFAEAWNFGPNIESVKSVQWIVEQVAPLIGLKGWHTTSHQVEHEAINLLLDIEKARTHMGWRPRMNIKDALQWTADWYVNEGKGHNMRDLTLRQIGLFEELIG